MADVWNYVVVCRDDMVDGEPGGYTLATRRVFHTRPEAVAYAASVAQSREPLVIEGRWAGLRFNQTEPRYGGASDHVN